MNDLEKAYMDDYAASFFPPDTPSQDLPEVFPMRAGALDGEMKAIEQSDFQRLAEKAGMTLEEFGQSLESLGSVNIGGFEVSLRDLVPFVGFSEDVPAEEMRTLTGKPVSVEGEQISGEEVTQERGFPQAAKQIGQGMSPFVGSGMTTELRPDFKEAVFDLFELTGILKAGGVAGKKAVDSIETMASETARDVNVMTKEVGEAVTKRRAQGAK